MRYLQLPQPRTFPAIHLTLQQKKLPVSASETHKKSNGKSNPNAMSATALPVSPGDCSRSQPQGKPLNLMITSGELLNESYQADIADQSGKRRVILWN